MPTDAATADEWRDHKRPLWPLGAVIMLLPLVGVAAWFWTGGWLWLWLAMPVLYALIPALDRVFGEDRQNPPDAVIGALAEARYYRWALYAAIPVYFITWTFMAWFVVHAELPWYGWLGATLSAGVICGLAINVAHELGHQNSGAEQFLARLTLAPGAYGHFFVEHNRGHHVRVATPEDPASSRLGESFYAFFPRCVVGSFRSAWALERARLANHGQSVWHWRNHNLQAWAMTAVIWGAMMLWLGWTVLPFLLVAAVYGGSLLEVVNYLEHYGLKRQKKVDGRYERCQPEHSWNSNHRVTNVLLYHLQRHSDHHANPTRSYQTLRNFEGVPSLPSGYAAMILLAYLPPLWFKLMDRKVLAQYGGDLTKANIQPGREAAVKEKYSAQTA